MITSLYEGIKPKVQGGDISEEFVRSNGFKPRSVLAPALLSSYLTSLPNVAFKDGMEGVNKQTGHVAEIFNMAHLKA